MGVQAAVVDGMQKDVVESLPTTPVSIVRLGEISHQEPFTVTSYREIPKINLNLMSDPLHFLFKLNAAPTLTSQSGCGIIHQCFSRKTISIAFCDQNYALSAYHTWLSFEHQ
jgi:hypothetical protein